MSTVLSVSAPLDPAAANDRLSSGRFRNALHYERSVTSTNTLALEAAHSGVEAGVWIADEQTAGRGRGGHAWHSAAGEGLYVSALVRPRMQLAQALLLSLATGLAVQHAIASITGLAADIRWPNDILLDGRKCAGILVETSSDASANLRYAVIGVGINVNQQGFPPELEPLATSLARETSAQWPREPLLAELLNALDREIDLLQAEISGDSTTSLLLARYAAASTWVSGKQVQVAEDGGYTGVTAGLDPQGFLRVVAGDGSMRLVRSGGVRAK